MFCSSSSVVIETWNDSEEEPKAIVVSYNVQSWQIHLAFIYSRISILSPLCIHGGFKYICYNCSSWLCYDDFLTIIKTVKKIGTNYLSNEILQIVHSSYI